MQISASEPLHGNSWLRASCRERQQSGFKPHGNCARHEKIGWCDESSDWITKGAGRNEGIVYLFANLIDVYDFPWGSNYY